MANNATGPQSKRMTLYNAADTTVVIDGTVLFGFQGGSDIFQLTWDNDRASINQDSFGSSVVSRNNKDSATLTINLNITSPMNDLLTKLCLENKVFTTLITTDTDEVTCEQSVITKLGDISAGDTAPLRAWSVHLLNANANYVGNKN